MKKVIIHTFLILLMLACKNNQINKEKLLTSKIETSFYKNQNNDHYPSKRKSLKQCFSKQIRVYLDDPDTSGTNIRKKPNGEVITKLIVDNLNHDYIITVTEAKNGWFKIKNPIIGMENDVIIPNNEGWIHGSVIAVDTRNYSGQHLNILEKPVNGKIVTIIKEETIQLKLKELCGDWVKIEYNNTIGWIESKWLCGNPLTNCS